MTSVDEALSYDRDAVGIGRKGTIDKPYLLKAPFWTVDTLFYAIPKEDMDLEFVHCSFLTVDWKSKDESTGLPSLSKEAINETIALVPSFNEQSRLGEFFNNLDSLITLHQREVEPSGTHANMFSVHQHGRPRYPKGRPWKPARARPTCSATITHSGSKCTRTGQFATSP